MDAPIKLPPVLAYIVGAPIAPRSSVERLIERAIEALDMLDGDPDLEDDDPSGQCDEDEVNTADWLVDYTPGAIGAGCPISDPGEYSHPPGAF